MKTFNKNVELQFDLERTNPTIRVNVDGTCKLRICHIPKKLFIDNNSKIQRYVFQLLYKQL